MRVPLWPFQLLFLGSIKHATDKAGNAKTWEWRKDAGLRHVFLRLCAAGVFAIAAAPCHQSVSSLKNRQTLMDCRTINTKKFDRMNRI